MARRNTIAVSDEEKAELDQVREAQFGTDSVPYGEVIQMLVDDYDADD